MTNPPIGQIDDPGDPRVADYVGMRAGTTAHDVVIAESLNVLQQLVGSGLRIRSVLTLAKKADRVAAALGDREVPILVAPEAVLSATVGFDLHRGVVAAADRPPAMQPASVTIGARRIAVLEGTTDLENLGAIFRNAAALGIEGVLLDPGCADPLHRRPVRVSMGWSLRVPFARLDPWPNGLSSLRDDGFALLALTPSPDAEPIDVVTADLPARIAVVVGSEGPGLSQEVLAAADRRIRIPMARGVDSLNVAVAAAIAFHQLAVRA